MLSSQLAHARSGHAKSAPKYPFDDALRVLEIEAPELLQASALPVTTNAQDGREATSSATAEGELARALASMPLSKRMGHVEATVLRVVSMLTSNAVDVETSLMDAGIDSLAATEFSSRLKAICNVSLSPTLIFDHPTARSVAAHVLEQVSGPDEMNEAAQGLHATISSVSQADAEVVWSSAAASWAGGCGGFAVRMLWACASEKL
jgi:hypothetical protein